MIRFSLRTVALAVAAGVLAPAAVPAIALSNDTALSGATVDALDGTSVSINEMRGDVVLVNFWATWCKPCRKELPVLEAWRRELEGHNVQFMAISIDNDRKKVERFVKKHAPSLPIYHDGPDGLAQELDIPYLPCTYVLDAQGNVALVSPGADEASLNEIRSMLTSLATARQTSDETPVQLGRE